MVSFPFGEIDLLLDFLSDHRQAVLDLEPLDLPKSQGLAVLDEARPDRMEKDRLILLVLRPGYGILFAVKHQHHLPSDSIIPAWSP